MKLYFNADIVTLEGDNIEAILCDEGKIIATGSLADLSEKAKDAEKIDLNGNTLLPAFIDPHSHFVGVAYSYINLSLENCTSYQEIEETVKNFIAENNLKEGDWISTNQYDHNNLVEKKHPHKSFLDAIAPNNPLVLKHVSGHVGVFNSCALAALNITNDIEDVDGGLYQRDENGELTGYLEENAYIPTTLKIPQPTMEKLAIALNKGQKCYASYGITTCQEGMLAKQLAPIYQLLMHQKSLYLDVVTYPSIQDYEEVVGMFPNNVKEYNNNMRIGGVKMFLDGSPQGRTAWMKNPYLGSEDYVGYPTMKPEAIAAAVKFASDRDLQLLSHANGDAACYAFIEGIKNAPKKMDRPVMIHSQLVDHADLDAVKELDIIPSYFAAHVYHWGDVHITNFGEKRAGQISPLKSSLDKDILFTLHQDSPIIKPNILESVWIACNRLTKNGVVLGSEEIITPYEAIKAVTINAAYQYHEEDSKGSIKVGKNADFVILDKNPLKVDVATIKDIKVLETIKDNNSIYKA